MTTNTKNTNGEIKEAEGNQIPLELNDLISSNRYAKPDDKQGESSVETTVRDYLITNLRNQKMSVSRCARAIGMGTRTLQRRLKEDGVTFRKLLLETRNQMKEELLKEVKATQGEIAAALGYSDARSLRRRSSIGTDQRKPIQNTSANNNKPG